MERGDQVLCEACGDEAEKGDGFCVFCAALELTVVARAQRAGGHEEAARRSEARGRALLTAGGGARAA